MFGTDKDNEIFYDSDSFFLRINFIRDECQKDNLQELVIEAGGGSDDIDIMLFENTKVNNFNDPGDRLRMSFEDSGSPLSMNGNRFSIRREFLTGAVFEAIIEGERAQDIVNNPNRFNISAWYLIYRLGQSLIYVIYKKYI